MAGGRPPKFKSPEDMQKAIDAYFADCEAKELPLTVTGLALALDTTRETIMDYQEKDEYSDTIKRAKLRVQNYAEKRLFGNNATGPIFALKNFGWSDKQEQHVTGTTTVIMKSNIPAAPDSDK